MGKRWPRPSDGFVTKFLVGLGLFAIVVGLVGLVYAPVVLRPDMERLANAIGRDILLVQRTVDAMTGEPERRAALGAAPLQAGQVARHGAHILEGLSQATGETETLLRVSARTIRDIGGAAKMVLPGQGLDATAAQLDALAASLEVMKEATPALSRDLQRLSVQLAHISSITEALVGPGHAANADDREERDAHANEEAIVPPLTDLAASLQETHRAVEEVAFPTLVEREMIAMSGLLILLGLGFLAAAAMHDKASRILQLLEQNRIGHIAA